MSDQPRRKPILSLDYDGVLSSYTSGWIAADVCPDVPVDGAMQFVSAAVEHFRVAIYSSRSNQQGGVQAMKTWMRLHLLRYWGNNPARGEEIFQQLEWPTEKPSAMIGIDDRVLTFDGTWPDMDTLRNFKPWNKR